MFIRFQGCNLHCKWPCDTEYALDPTKGMERSCEQIIQGIPYQSNVVLTGGEPFLQPKEELIELVRGLEEDKKCLVQIETNGSIFCTWLNVPFILDFKLPSSGMMKRMMSDSCFASVPNKSWIKFVVKTEEDLQIAIQKIKDFEVLSCKRECPLKYALSVETGQQVQEAFKFFDFDKEKFDFPLHRIAFNVQIHKILGLA